MKKYLVYSTVLSVFSEALFITVGIDLKFFYLIVLVNLPIMLTHLGFAKMALQKWHLCVLGFFLLNGFLSIYVFKTNLLPNWLEQVVGIGISSYYYYLFFSMLDKEEFHKVFQLYVSIAFFMIVIGFFRYPLDVYREPLRFRSFFIEPSHFVTYCMPVFFYFLAKKSHVKMLVVLLAFLCAVSSVGFIGMMLCLLLRFRFSAWRFMLSLLVTAGLGVILYNAVPDFRLRVDDSSKSFTQSTVSETNLSTFALFSNAFVTANVFNESPVMGNGLGSHVLSRDKYLKKLDGVEVFEEYFFLNSRDANSLMLRVISDLGLIGVVLVIAFLAKNYVPGNNEYNVLCKAVLVYILLKLFREGHYFSVEMYFFVMFYYFNKRFSKESIVDGQNELNFAGTNPKLTV